MPPQLHIHLLTPVSAGLHLINTFGWPGTHGAAITGTHGIGVRTPAAAAVADATVGLDKELHVPKGGIFIIGLLSMITAAVLFSIKMLIAEIAISVEGAAPKLHLHCAVVVTI